MTPEPITPDPRPETPDPVAPADWLSLRRFALVLAALLAVTFWRVLFGGEAFFYRDYGFLGYPFAHFHRECFWSGDFFPLWNPYVNCGAPFLAQWNTLCLYPGALIYLLLPLPWSLGFFCVAHLFLGGMGMRALAERWTGSRFGAAVAGVAFVFSGLVLGCVIYPNYLVALGWMPWVVLATRRAWQEGGRNIVLASLAGAMQMLTGAPEIILLTWGFLAALALTEVFSVQCSVFSGATKSSAPPEPSGAKTEYWKLNTDYFSVARRFAAVISLIAALTAAQLLPFFQLLSLSQRSGDAVNTFWSLPGWGWVNLFFPLFMNFQTEQGVFVMIGQSFFPSVYLGIVPLTLALLAVWRIGLRRRDDVVRTEAGGALVAAVPPHPGPLPPGEGERQSALGFDAAPSAQARSSSPPLPAGEGRGEGEGPRQESSMPGTSQSRLLPPAVVWEVRLLAGATLLAVLLAMGDNFVLWRWLREVLPLGIMRFPVKALLLAAFTVPLLAAWGVAFLEFIASQHRGKDQRTPDDALDSLDTFFERAGMMNTAARIGPVFTVVILVAIIVFGQAHWWPVPMVNIPKGATGFLAHFNTWTITILVLSIALISLVPRRRTLGAGALLLLLGWNGATSNEVLRATIPASAFDPGLAAAYHTSKGALTPTPKLGEGRIMLSPLAERALHTRMVPKFYDDFIGQRLAFWGNLNLLDGLPKVNGASTLVTREWNDVEYFLYGTTNPAPANLMDFLGVTHTTKPGELMQWERRQTAMSLVSLPVEAVAVYRSQSFAALTQADWNPRSTAYLTFEAPDDVHFTPVKRIPFSTGSVRMLRFSPTRLEFESDTMERRPLVVAQNHYPSWQVTVNGETEFVAKANHAFQAIMVPAGKSTIRLDYVDWPFRIGAGISLVTLLGCVVLWRRG